jgi:hypothetical protein
MPLATFIDEIFYAYAYDLRGTCVGFNLPFDISRIALDHGIARGKMRGGFSFILSTDKKKPRVQIRHLNSRAALKQFAAPRGERTPRGMKRRGLTVKPHRGFFVDVRTLAGALLGGSWSLARLAQHLTTEHQKLETDEHGGELTDEYIGYAIQDVQVTWECYEKLRQQFECYGLTKTFSSQLYSEASLGKAYLREMGIKPWQELQPDVPPELLGAIMSSYHGGRSEVRIRRAITRVLYCDFVSMYPTVCTLMGLWQFVIAERMEWHDATTEVQTFLEKVTIEQLQRREIWPEFTTLVQLEADGDIVPVRCAYCGAAQRTIGLNCLECAQPLWFTLADCIASKLLSGKVPRVLKAIRFDPVGIQPGLRPINIAGNPEYRVDPARDDFYRRLIELRQEVKAKRKAALDGGDTELAARLDAEQLALKLCANATSYGIFMELNVTQQTRPIDVTCYGADGEGFSCTMQNVEVPGTYFHPLLGTLITGAARLMLAITERLAADRGLSWAFCDTDSMALTKPDDMNEEQFAAATRSVIDWFTELNPYRYGGELLEIEDVNFGLRNGKMTGVLEPLYCYAISAKRYALFNLDACGRPVLRKISAHGLGHLVAPYQEHDSPKSIPRPSVPLKDMGVERWQYDVWYRIVKAALGKTPDQVKLGDLPHFPAPAVSRYGATTPRLLKWFDRYNRGRFYRQRVRPFGFLYAYQDQGLLCGGSSCKPVSTYDGDATAGNRRIFDRESGTVIELDHLKIYAQALAQYHLHPEDKFRHGDHLDQGMTSRRTIVAQSVEYIGKEADRWEEQYYLGLSLDAQIVYGPSPEAAEASWNEVRRPCQSYGLRKVAAAAGLSHTHVRRLLNGEGKRSQGMLARLRHAMDELEEGLH